MKTLKLRAIQATEIFEDFVVRENETIEIPNAGIHYPFGNKFYDVFMDDGNVATFSADQFELITTKESATYKIESLITK